MFKRISGTKDLLPQEISWWQEIEEKSRRIFSLYNYQEIRPPLIEEASLFNRCLGQTSEITQKQMFLIKNKEELYALRPEGTASIVRAYIENGLAKNIGFVKLYYIGPMFRLERPQKGRLRQFHHIGCEAIGSGDASLDIEVISLADTLLKNFSILEYKIKINTLGCPEDKKRLMEILRREFKDKVALLCQDCKRRFKENILRILDCKNETCIEVVRKINIQSRFLCEDCNKHFSKVKEGLDALNIKYEISPYLVRGLDYYTRTVFEITHPDLGSQDALGAGGRYDSLVHQLGGPQLGAMGFAFGMERLYLVSKSKGLKVKSENLVYLICLGEEAKGEGIKLLANLRQSGITSDTDYENKSLKGAMRKANDSGARFVLILGEDELKKKVITLKDMQSGSQEELVLDKCTENIRNKLKL